MALRSLVPAALLAGVTAVLAQISLPLPFSPVPLTGQTLGVCLAGAVLGGRTGALSVLVYLLMGACGLPVFAGARAGAGVLLGPTGGYLVGFVPGAYLCGRILEGHPSPGYPRTVLAMAACLAATYAAGLGWLSASLHLDPARALWAGLIPFLPGEVLKLALAAALAVPLRRALKAAGMAGGPAGVRARR